MFNLFKKREASRIFLGNLAVVPLSDFENCAEQWTMFGTQNQDLDQVVLKDLEALLPLPAVSEIKDPRSNDFALDVMIPSFTMGEFGMEEIFDIPIGLFWRPKVRVAARLYNIKTGKTKRRFAVLQRMGFRTYLNRAFSLRGVFRYKPLFEPKDLEHLTGAACYKILSDVQKHLK